MLYIVNEFPAMTQTYIRSEIEALREDYEISVIHLRSVPITYETDIPYRQLFDLPDLIAAVRDAKPKVLHTHFVMFAPLLDKVSAATGVPFTVRSHSFDVFGYLRDHFAHWSDGTTVPEVIDALNSPRCLGVLAFPFMREYFEDSGVRREQVHDCFPVVNFDLFYDRSANGDGVMNLGAGLANKQMEDYLRLAAAVEGPTFDLYVVGLRAEELRKLNEEMGSPVRLLEPVPPPNMPAEYKKHRWLVYTASFEENAVGWPMALAEAQASGVGVCAPNLRPDLKEYVSDGGILYDDVMDVREIVAGPVPEEMREAGFELARRSDIRQHIGVLTSLW